MDVAVLLTDIEGSTQLVERVPVAYSTALRQHVDILQAAASNFNGTCFHDSGDGFSFAFDDPADAAAAALKIEIELAAVAWPAGIDVLRIRMALHVAELEFRDGQYRGAGIHLVARLLASGHGGQILCSKNFRDSLGERYEPKLLGTYLLRGFQQPAEIFQLNGEKNFPPLSVQQARRHNLPVDQDVFVGRVSEIEDISGRLYPGRGDGRMITLLGPGGIGKTRLAIAVARKLLEAYDHNVLFVGLGEQTLAESIPTGILDALGAAYDSSRSSLSQVVELLEPVPALIVLDNLERLADGSLDVLADLLASLPRLRLLVTSRVKLGLAEEREWVMSPLSLPPVETAFEKMIEYDSVKLFLARAEKARQDFLFSSENAVDVLGVCILLDGIPLAIEIAAARLQVLTARELHESLQSHIQENGGGLEGAFLWSARLLPPDILRFLNTLSIFRGGWTAHAAQKVGAVDEPALSLAYLHYLLACSLVRVSEVSGRMRFRMLEPLRQIAYGNLGDMLPDVIERHWSVYRLLMKRIADDLNSDREYATTLEVQPEVSNIIAAMQAATTNQRRVTAAIGFSGFAQHRTCHYLVREMFLTSNLEDESLTLFIRGRAWHALGVLERTAGNTDAALLAFRRAQEIFELDGDDVGVATAGINQAILQEGNGKHENAYSSYLDAYEFYLGKEMHGPCVIMLGNLASVAWKMERYELVEVHAAEALKLAYEHQLTSLRPYPLGFVINLHCRNGRFEEGLQRCDELLKLVLEAGWETDYGNALIKILQFCIRLNKWEEAAFFSGAALESSVKFNDKIPDEIVSEINDIRVKCLLNIKQNTFDSYFDDGRNSFPNEWLERLRNL